MNKKIYLFAIVLLAAFFIGCDDVYDHVSAPPQAYEEEPVQSIDGFSFSIGSPLSSPLVLTQEALDEGAVYEAIKTNATPSLAEGATVVFKLEASDSENFEKVVELPSTSTNNTASVLAEALDTVVKSLYDKSPNAREIYLRATYFIVDGSTSSRMPSPVVLGPITITPAGPVIEEAYYLIGDLNGWGLGSLNEESQFSHSGANVYDDPIFTILVNGMEGNFKVAPKSANETGDWALVLGNTESDGNTALEGEFLADGGSMKVEQPGWVRVTINMMEGTYTIELIGEMNVSLYVPGGHQGWSPETAPMLYSRNFDFTYDGFVYFDGAHEFKFTATPSWDVNYGAGDEPGVLVDNGGNLHIEEEGYYLLTVDLSGAPYTYKAEKTEWGLIGDATQGGWDTSTPMEFDPDTGVWTVTAALEVGSYKFRANDEWNINVGGSLTDLVFGGDNLAIQEAGTYFITLDLSDPTAFKATLVKQ